MCLTRLEAGGSWINLLICTIRRLIQDSLIIYTMNVIEPEASIFMYIMIKAPTALFQFALVNLNMVVYIVRSFPYIGQLYGFIFSSIHK